MLSLILAMLIYFLSLALLSFLIFLVRTYLIIPLISAEVRKVEPQANWLTTRGILDSQVRLEKKHWHFSRARAFYLEIPSHYADIHVTYLVNGTSYIIRPPMSWGDEVSSVFHYKAAELVTKYQSGKQVMVRYDPNNPQRAAIVMEGE